jgi:hypothetical protein
MSSISLWRKNGQFANFYIELTLSTPCQLSIQLESPPQSNLKMPPPARIAQSINDKLYAHAYVECTKKVKKVIKIGYQNIVKRV